MPSPKSLPAIFPEASLERVPHHADRGAWDDGALHDHRGPAGLVMHRRTDLPPPPLIYFRSILPPSAGVPTAINVISVCLTASARSVVARRRLPAWRASSSGNPAS